MVAVLGIDVAKDSLALALLGPPSPRKRTFANISTGHQELLSWLSKQHLSEIQVCLEATGSYADAIAEALHDAQYPVSIVTFMFSTCFLIPRTKQAGEFFWRSLLLVQ